MHWNGEACKEDGRKAWEDGGERRTWAFEKVGVGLTSVVMGSTMASPSSSGFNAFNCAEHSGFS